MLQRNKRGNLVFIHPELGFEIELLRYSDPERKYLAEAAATYLDKPDIDNINRPLSLIRLGHALEIFRGEHARFKFTKTTKQVYDHLVTYKTMDMRVAGGNRANISKGYTPPIDRTKNPLLVDKFLEDSMHMYHTLAEIETPQVARAIQPVNSHMVAFILQFNFQTLIESLFVQRIWEKGAQGLTVETVKGMWELCHAVDAELWDVVLEHFGPHVKSWKEAQKALRKKKVTVAEMIQKLQEANPEDFAETTIRNLYGKEYTMW